MSNKYINIFNDKLTFMSLGEECKRIKNLNLFSLQENEIEKISISNSLTSFYINDIKYNIFYENLIDSGSLDNDRKRVIISKTNSAPSSSIFIPILYYYSGNKCCYVLLFDKSKFIWDYSIKNRSIWVDFSDIYACLKYSLNIKTKNYLISNNIKNLLQKPELFETLDKYQRSKIKKEIDDYKAKKIIIPNNPFEIKSNYKKKNDKRTTNISNKNIGYKAEKYVNEILKRNLLESELKKIEHKLRQKIENVIWNNEFEESFLPYDFKINSKIFLEVKGTEKKEENFVISNDEWNFKELKKNKYYLINVININHKTSIKIYNFKELNNINFKKKIQYKYVSNNSQNNKKGKHG